jgi:hypothetical protein
MTALWSGPQGDVWKKSKIQILGWLNVGGSFSTSKAGVHPSAGKYANFPTAYDEVPNAIETEQEVLYIERQPDTVRTDHFDWGFRFFRPEESRLPFHHEWHEEEPAYGSGRYDFLLLRDFSLN